MANSDYLLEIARSGSEAWNQWRRDNPQEKVDFSGVDFTPDEDENQGISFRGFEFGDHADFAGATFGDLARFEGATFGDRANFEGATFGDHAYFAGATFGDRADFVDATFGGRADFVDATFGYFAWFAGATFEHRADFVDATFGYLARFEGATFGGRAIFEGVTFGYHANFEGATVGDYADFEGATFGDHADFGVATFGDRTDFEGATFGYHARFEGATFGDRANFEGATFGDRANFEGATFGDLARFEGATFGDLARFEGATFGDQARFEGATFKGTVRFNGTQQRSEPANRAEPEQPSSQYVADEATISSNLPEAGTYFRSISFSRARFLGRASFDERSFQGEADFSAASFAVPPDFRATEHRENLDWTEVRFAFGWYPRLGRLTIPVRGWTTRNDTVTRLRRLRGIAKEIHAVDAERDLFILERQAERGILWYDWCHGGWRTWLTGWWRPLTATVLIFLYRYSSNCGRSLLLPLVWLVASNWGFYHLNAFLIARPLFISVKKALFDLTFASAVPFGATARPAFQSAVKELFQQDSAGPIDIPWQIQAASAAQGITNLVLLFLLGLALRNFFKFK